MNGKCYLLDTNMLGYLAEAKAGAPSTESVALKSKLDSFKDNKTVFICAINAGEVEYGLKIAPFKDTSKQTLARQIVKSFSCLPIDDKIALDQYSDLRAKLFQKYAPKNKKKKRIEEWTDPTTSKVLQVQENDVWIAAVAMAYNLILVTHDKMNAIKAVAGGNLEITDWSK